MRAELQGEIRRLRALGITPGLAAVLVGDNPASTTYVRMKGKACDEAGLYHETIRLKAETTEAELLAVVDRLNTDPAIHGFLVQLPLPKPINAERVLNRVNPLKDVDGFHPVNVGKVSIGDPTGLRPATPSNVPLIGRTRYPNLYLNAGHGTLGWTMAAGSGKAIAEIVSGRKPDLAFAFSGY